VPNWQEINRDPRWLQWLDSPDTYSGYSRQQLLNGAVAAGNAGRVIAIFKGFLREVGAAGQAPARTAARHRQAQGPFYSRGQIVQMAAMRRKGQISDQEWAEWEHELIRAGREGRIKGSLNSDGVPIT